MTAGFFFFQAEDGIRDYKVTGVQTCALPISRRGQDPAFDLCTDRIARRRFRRSVETESCRHFWNWLRLGPGESWRSRRPARGIGDGLMFPPSRIVCLTEETVETLYSLGEQDRIVGISGYVVRPPQARRERPSVSAFTSANIEKILSLQPDLVLTFSDLQADIAADLIRRGIEVHAFNQRTVAGILDMIRMIGAMVGASERAEELVETLEIRLAEARHRAECLTKRPTVFFEEWDGPLISAIGWVSELVEIAG